MSSSDNFAFDKLSQLALNEKLTEIQKPRQQVSTFRQLIKFTHEEVEALLALFPEDPKDLSENERTAKEKLKKIYARQIISHERRQNYLDSFAKETENDLS